MRNMVLRAAVLAALLVGAGSGLTAPVWPPRAASVPDTAAPPPLVRLLSSLAAAEEEAPDGATPLILLVSLALLGRQLCRARRGPCGPR
jgi:hypothetical protein